MCFTDFKIIHNCSDLILFKVDLNRKISFSKKEGPIQAAGNILIMKFCCKSRYTKLSIEKIIGYSSLCD